ncbi:hypothetical protein CLV57_0677 [Mucilaginibacter auburnensis]|uniref:Uncharacterized protein n=1 Tax=Mucilaginibacter auburnensis TaxID=1457233 RepID=A0A2H9VS90_9SPHI|nr:hypothetical protein CLV57_0677 [Mucilaginibacter auburnensis]
MKNKPILIKILAALLTFICINVLLRLIWQDVFISDLFVSLSPGWHTAIRPNYLFNSTILMLSSLLIYLLYKGIGKVLAKILINFN